MVERRRIGVLDHVLGEVDVAEDTDEDCDGAPGLLAEQPSGRLASVYVADGPTPSTCGRISMVPQEAPGTAAATSIASSSVSHSTT